MTARKLFMSAAGGAVLVAAVTTRVFRRVVFGLGSMLAAVVVFVASTVVVVASPTAVGAQLQLAPIEGRVIEESFFETQSFPYRVVTIAPTDGGPERSIAALGGPRADGTVAAFSHQPELPLGAVVHVKVLAPIDESIEHDLRAVGYSGPPPLVVVGGSVNETVLERPSVAEGKYVLSGWKIDKMPTEYTISTNGPSAAKPEASVKNGIAWWENDACSTVSAKMTGTAPGGFDIDGKNTISWRPASEFPDSTLLGMASVAFRNGTVIEWDVGFNKAAAFSATPASGRFDLPTVAAHEFGHVIGLDHSTVGSDLMGPIIHSGERKPLASADRNGLRKLYGSDCEGARTCGGAVVTVDLAKQQKPTTGDDVILGTTGNDDIQALGGDDIVCGGGGDDRIVGGAGADILIGGGGNDNLVGGPGPDKLDGGPGNDRLSGMQGRDRLSGGKGDDLLSGGNQRDRCLGGPQSDVAKGCEVTKSVP